MTGRKRVTFLAVLAAAPLIALTVAACGGGRNAASSTALPTTPRGRPATLGVQSNSDLGKILDDAHGRTLYLFQKDSGTRSACTGACASAWPPLRTSGKPTAGTGASASLLGTTMRSDGQKQVTYNGHPLYTYAADHNPGDTNGQGLTVFGGGWFALSPVGDQVSGTGSNGGASGY